jgi:cysteine sulfinate desulfinase/cysteine desulfurase-like protein
MLLVHEGSTAGKILVMAATKREVILSGSFECSSGKRVPVRVILDCPVLTRAEERELENAQIALHDLTPIRT